MLMNYRFTLLAIITLLTLSISATQKTDCQQMLEVVQEFARDVRVAARQHEKYNTERTQDNFYAQLEALYDKAAEAAARCPELGEELFWQTHQFCD